MKRIKLIFSLLKTSLFETLVLLLVVSSTLTAATVLSGRCGYFYAGYNALNKSAFSDCAYGFKTLKGKTDFSQLNTALLSVPGVRSVVEKPFSVNFYTVDRAVYSLTYVSRELYEGFELDLKHGSGFDYSSDTLECITASEYFTGSKPGETFTAYSQNKDADGNYTYSPVDFTVAGTADPSALFVKMTGGGTKMSAENLLSQVNTILVKDCPAARAAFEAEASGGSYSAFIRFEDGLTDKQLSEAYAELSKLVTLESVEEILDNTMAKAREQTETYAPIIIFCAVFSFVTLVCLSVLSIYKYAPTCAVWYALGENRHRLVMTVASSFFLTLLCGFLLSLAASFWMIGSVEQFKESAFSALTVLPSVCLALLDLLVCAAACYYAVNGKSARGIIGKYIA